jgi:hypothetical protein
MEGTPKAVDFVSDTSSLPEEPTREGQAMPITDEVVAIIQRNAKALDALDDHKLIMAALSEIVFALSSESGDKFIPRGTGIPLAAVLAQRAGLRDAMGEPDHD